ncbi:MAG: DNA (cytosine-5)-methyltransferase 1 [Akkermansiaceae bacterium]|jgi:DNA (cytosine-5)-methyltransferase 1
MPGIFPPRHIPPQANDLLESGAFDALTLDEGKNSPIIPTVTSPKNTPSEKGSSAVAVDLFCGAGGLTRGLKDSGIEVVAGYDNDPACGFPYEKNNSGSRFKLKSVADLSAEEVEALYPIGKTRILVGCAPCQPFSKYTQGSDTKDDAKWGLLLEFGRLIKAVKPEIVSMENVPEIQRHEVVSQFTNLLESEGYHVSHTIAYCPDYGIPQQRRRLVLLASRLGPIELITLKVKNAPTVREAISHLPKLKAGQGTADPMHRSCRLSPLNLKRMKASKPGGCWRDWPNHLVAKCHRNDSGKYYASVYGRMEWDSPSPTITTQFFGFGNGRFGHPEQNRAITLREGAILQSFPEDYEFIEPDSKASIATVGRLIGNAVPVLLGKAIGQSISNHLAHHA